MTNEETLTRYFCQHDEAIHGGPCSMCGAPWMSGEGHAVPTQDEAAAAFDKLRAALAAEQARREEAERRAELNQAAVFSELCDERDALRADLASARAEVERWHRDGTALAGELATAQEVAAAATKRADEAERERDDARDWVRRLTASERVLTCVYCGIAYPPGSPTHGAAVLTEHIRVCEKHPLRAVEKERDKARSDLAAAHARGADLVVALPACDICGAPATRAFKRGSARYCDEHGGKPDGGLRSVTGSYTVPEYPRAAPLRALVAALPSGAINVAMSRMRS